MKSAADVVASEYRAWRAEGVMSAGAVLALDAGQTAIKARLRRPGCEDITLELPGVLTHEPLLPQLAAAVRFAEAESGPVQAVAAGVSGLTSAESDARELRDHFAAGRDIRVALAHDSVTSYLGALGDRPGVVVAAGTGVVTLGVGPHAVARVDGWGNIMGDAGSAYWIGREGLDAVMRAFDGRGEHTCLEEAALQRWGRLDEAYIALQGSPDRVRTVAQFAIEVTAQAHHDAVALRICGQAAAELALAVTTALQRVADPAGFAPVVCALGGVFRSDVIAEAFGQALKAAAPSVEQVGPLGDGLDGAMGLLELAPGHPLLGHVSVAGQPQRA